MTVLVLFAVAAIVFSAAACILWDRHQQHRIARQAAMDRHPAGTALDDWDTWCDEAETIGNTPIYDELALQYAPQSDEVTAEQVAAIEMRLALLTPVTNDRIWAWLDGGAA